MQDAKPAEARSQHYAHSMSIDRRVKRHVERETGLAINLLRSNFESIMQAKLKAPDKPLPQHLAKWFELLEEAISTPKDDKELKPVVPINLNIIRPSTNGSA